MLVTFRCKGHENITYLGHVALQLIGFMGHSEAVPGAILAADVPSALASLQASLITHHQNADDSSPMSADEPPVKLQHRALPLIALLQDAIRHQSNVMWDDPAHSLLSP